MSQMYRRNVHEIVAMYGMAAFLGIIVVGSFTNGLIYGSLPGDLLWRLTGCVPMGIGIYVFVLMARASVVFKTDSFLYTDAFIRREIPWHKTKEVVVQQSPYLRAVVYYVDRKNRETKIEIQIGRFRNTNGIIDQFTKVGGQKGITVRREP